jgi:hypothetical protein
MQFMGALTEVEIFDCMRTNLSSAIQHCEDLAVAPLKGLIYEQLVKELKLIEGSCRQASAWREDTRWLNLVPGIAAAHKHAGSWLRGFKVEGHLLSVKLSDKQSHYCFTKLADNLRGIIVLIDQTKSMRTGHVGMILPQMLAAPTRTQGRSVGVSLPEGMRSH